MSSKRAQAIGTTPNSPLDRHLLGDPARTCEHERRTVLGAVIRSDHALMAVLRAARDIRLPDWRVASGAIYQTLWNVLTGRPQGHGIKDYDLIYFDGSDLSFEAEDRLIAKAAKYFSFTDKPVEIRNQARVHLWYPQKFGIEYKALTCSDESLTRYLSPTQAIAVRLEDDDNLDIVAPFGLANAFAMRIVPNPIFSNPVSYRRKAMSAKENWPELEVAGI
ncbi:nucleotidyltransferase family protein [Stappia sp. F7233]|uniref:Nucleotidyltransferase family protein n=1 Tax=Stappia albiluteola TaxID=2758565 RepID=A0A839AAU5_9HYPH|nr:nucleotidyltransferase family protein [Stappia albiluteola]MBA5775859.1 nucleotidyltransferase family protein [Stappia albiluteola]